MQSAEEVGPMRDRLEGGEVISSLHPPVAFLIHHDYVHSTRVTVPSQY